LIGVAGAGMRSLAEVLLGWGWQLTGSDRAPEPAQHLTARGLRLRRGHAAEAVRPSTELVVYSSAITPGNPELRRALDLGIPALSYFEMLGRLMVGRRGLAVAGTHGKSTTTAMAAKLLLDAGLDPTVVYGAAPLGKPGGGHAGRGPVLLVEACEYLANFLHLQPRFGVILNIEPDHFDCFHSLAQLEGAFARFARAVPDDGLVLARSDYRSTRRVTAGLDCRVETFGFDRRADWSALRLTERRGRYSFCVARHGSGLGEVSLQVPGRHSVLNALAAAALAWENGLRPEQIARGLSRFRGLTRRLEVVGLWRGVVMVDDYAHHPTEIDAALGSLRRMYPGQRVWCVFQPHQVSRTQRLLHALAASLTAADQVVVAEIYRAREPDPIPGEVTGADLARQVRALGGNVAEVHQNAQIVQLLANRLRPGDVLITMGAGDIREICHGLMERFREDRAAG
jgi:UDP-N-acetylmuramate--alanine ligase